MKSSKINCQLSLFLAPSDFKGKWEEQKPFFILEEDEKPDPSPFKGFPFGAKMPVPSFMIEAETGSEFLTKMFHYTFGPKYSHDTQSDSQSEKYNRFIQFGQKWSNLLKEIDQDYEKVLDNPPNLT